MRLSVLFNKGSRTFPFEFSTAQGETFSLVDLDVELRIGDRPIDDPATEAKLVIPAVVHVPATAGVASVTITAEHTVQLGFGTHYANVYVSDENGIIANGPPILLSVVATEGNADA